MRTYSIVVEPDGGYFVTVPPLPGCFTSGQTIEECQARAVEAIKAHIAGLESDGEPGPGGAWHRPARLGDRSGVEDSPRPPVDVRHPAVELRGCASVRDPSASRA